MTLCLVGPNLLSLEMIKCITNLVFLILRSQTNYYTFWAQRSGKWPVIEEKFKRLYWYPIHLHPWKHSQVKISSFKCVPFFVFPPPVPNRERRLKQESFYRFIFCPSHVFSVTFLQVRTDLSSSTDKSIRRLLNSLTQTIRQLWRQIWLSP